MSCEQCQGIELQFDGDVAKDDLKSYHKKGLSKTTGWLVDYLISLGVDEMSLLDIGGGIGMIQHKLLAAGVKSATHVDASSAYLEAAKEEATRLGLEDSIQFVYGDFVELSKELGSFDIVSMDKVICCFDDMQALVDSSSKKADKYYAIIFPQENWWNKIAFSIVGFFIQFRSNPFSVFIHSTEAINKIINRNGLSQIYLKRGLFWQFIVYAR